MDTHEILAPVRGVILFQLGPEAARFHPHDRIGSWVVVRPPFKDLRCDDRFLRTGIGIAQPFLYDEAQDSGTSDQTAQMGGWLTSVRSAAAPGPVRLLES